MNEIVRPELFAPPLHFQKFELTKSQLDLIWDINRDLTPREFDQFIETARALGLNPLRRQICTVVFSKNDPTRRRMAIVTTIMGLRAIADRTGTYRPDRKPARITTDHSRIHAKANPGGFVDCLVTPYRFAHGKWFPLVGQVWWDEIAPIRSHDGELMLDSRTPWPARPRGQFVKCAEADGLRRGWPEDLSNVYAEDEVDRARMLELPPSQAAEEAKKDRLIEQVRPKGTILIDMADGNGLSNVPSDSFHDRVSMFIRDRKADPAAVLAWRDQQRIAFQSFFAHDKNAALDLKQQFEALETAAGGLVGRDRSDPKP
jgi:phage recombination protein Bet